MYSQQANPPRKVHVVPLPYYLPVIHTSEVYQDTSVGSSAASSKGSLLPYSSQLGKKGYSSFVRVPENQPVVEASSRPLPAQKIPDWNVHGNILYNVDYRSYIDTPYAEKDVYYHTIQTCLDVVYKNRYPMRVYLTNRFSNSAFTRQFSDISMQFNTADFKNRIVQAANLYINSHAPKDSLAYWQQLLDGKRNQAGQLQAWVNDPATMQQLIEAKEKALYPGNGHQKTLDSSALNWNELSGQLNNKPHMPGAKEVPAYLQGFWRARRNAGTDTVPSHDSSFTVKYEAQKKRADSLQQELAVWEGKYRKYKTRLARLQQQRGKLDMAGSTNDLEVELKSNNVPDTTLPAHYKTLLAIKSFGIGRTLVDYSELSAKNVSINGIQVEYNPSYYVAIAAGGIDYRFRDFIVKNATAPGQFLTMVRVGKGIKNNNTIILTWYTGKKQVYNGSGATNVTQPDYHLMGFTLEGNYRVNTNTTITAEVAKSSMPYYNRPGNDKSLLSGTLRFNEHSNEAYAVKAQSLIKATDTRLAGFYKHYGANFQSFSLISTGVQQRAWMLKADQPFFRKKLTVSASLKENDYNNPSVNVAYSSNVVFKSLQATVRVPHWPVLMVGYYPSAQLTKLSNDEYTETMFYSLVANMNYYYQVHDIGMNSSAMYTRFYNKQTDSAFLYANTTNYMFSQSFFLRRLTGQSTVSVALSSDYHLYTAGNEAQYTLLQWLSAGAGITYNYQTGYNIEQVGYKGTAIIKIPKLGEIQLTMEKGFIPGANRQLVENRTGRFSFFKIF
ncbi:hypothetical protein [Filimonas lacunae]|uniref:hypothetical protein n=1 Tax=Filimonas lacunae TaxID=477680 RepID=UPI0009714AC3|nr:hypothetical protein [Filimonas lacunae]